MGRVESSVDALRGEPRAVIVCRSGGRSNVVAQLLGSLGVDAVNLAGGMRAWQDAGLPIVTDDGVQGRVI
jgi:rhodanese-related sulfurtransferase